MRISDRAAFAGLVLLGGCVSAQPLSEPEIQGLLPGHTAFLKGGFVEYYAPDGIVHGISDGVPYDGKWQIKDGAFCAALSGDPQVCTRVLRQGKELLWTPDGGKKPDRIENILPGNPKGL